MQANQYLTFDRYMLDLPNEQLWREKRPLVVASKAFAVLRYLLEHAGQVVTKAELFAALWPGTVVSDGALTVCIVELRKALGDNAKRPKFIEIVHGRGYRFLAAVTVAPVPSAEFQAPNPAQSRGQSLASRGRRQNSKPTPYTRYPIPFFVGREGELAQLSTCWEKALAGERQIIFVSGEPGIGKTTLVEAFLQRLNQNA